MRSDRSPPSPPRASPKRCSSWRRSRTSSSGTGRSRSSEFPGFGPLLDLDAEQFSLPIAAYTTSYFLTARLAARRMLANKSGVIMTVTALPARSGTRLNGGYGPAHAAREALTRDLSAELAPHGIRVVGLRPHGLPETSTMRDVYDLKAKATGMTWEGFQGYLAGMTHTRRVMTLDEVANMAVVMASDKASGMTGTTVNMTMGNLDD